MLRKINWLRATSSLRCIACRSISTQNEKIEKFLKKCNDHREIFRGKTTLELMRAAFLLKVCSYPIFANNAFQVGMISYLPPPVVDCVLTDDIVRVNNATSKVRLMGSSNQH